MQPEFTFDDAIDRSIDDPTRVHVTHVTPHRRPTDNKRPQLVLTHPLLWNHFFSADTFIIIGEVSAQVVASHCLKRLMLKPRCWYKYDTCDTLSYVTHVIVIHRCYLGGCLLEFQGYPAMVLDHFNGTIGSLRDLMARRWTVSIC